MPVGVAWIEATVRLGGDVEVARATSFDLEFRYAEAHRRYHGTSHVEAVLVDAAELAAAAGLDERDRAVLDLAVCAHDVVYDARPGDDERASADWARANLTAAGVDVVIVARVERLVMTTLTHDFDGDDRIAAVLSDADLSILGAEPDVYDWYSRAVREEFAAVPDDLWAAGRKHVLEHLLAKPRLFVTAAGYERWEVRARENANRELAALASAATASGR